MTDFWNDDRIATLRHMWGVGRSANAIADAFGDGATRNQVIGKAHRLGLSTRPSPIKARVVPLPLAIERSCEYPFGDPGEAGFRFCCAERQPGSPYCADHHACCYRRRQEVEA